MALGLILRLTKSCRITFFSGRVWGDSVLSACCLQWWDLDGVNSDDYCNFSAGQFNHFSMCVSHVNYLWYFIKWNSIHNVHADDLHASNVYQLQNLSVKIKYMCSRVFNQVYLLSNYESHWTEFAKSIVSYRINLSSSSQYWWWGCHHGDPGHCRPGEKYCISYWFLSET